MKIDLYGGKYTYLINDDGSNQRALRYGQPWRDLTGDGFVLAMAQKIEELEQSQPKWVSVEDELPDCDDFFIANFRNRPAFIAKAWKFTVHNPDGKFYKYTGGKTTHVNNVTHWMPIPQPPEVSDDD